MKTDHFKLNQVKLSRKVRIQSLDKDINYIAGVDVAVTPNFLIGCIGVFSFPELQLVEHSSARVRNDVPYIPGYLSFREIPVLIKCYAKLRNKPDLILVDGQGIAHPRAIGLASHLGIVLNKPTIGCAKSPLFGDYEVPDSTKGSYSWIKAGHKDIGLVLRTRDQINPLFVSPGHLVGFEDCRRYVFATLSKYRIPEPIRFAHKTAGEIAKRQ